MTDWFYIWDTRSAFGWAVLSGSPKGARRFDFGYASREHCLGHARVFADCAGPDTIPHDRLLAHPGPNKGPAWLFPAVVALTRFFLAEDVPLNLVPLDWTRRTDFEKAVWRATLRIPYGETRPYAWVAAQAGRPGGARAAGNALGANPLPVIVPCHRVIKSDGALGGFGLGAAMKRKLLATEIR